MKDLPTWSDLNKGVRKMTDKEFDYCEEMEKRKHDDKLKELREVQLLSQHILDLQKDKGKLIDENRELKILISSLVYEINQIWDINEMNDDLRRCAEKIDREVQLSKMAEDNRMVISVLGFAIVPPNPKLDVKEIKEK